MTPDGAAASTRSKSSSDTAVALLEKMLKLTPSAPGVAPSGEAAPLPAPTGAMGGAGAPPDSSVTGRFVAPPRGGGSPPPRLEHRARLRVPDLGRVLGDGAIAREEARGGDVGDGFSRPRLLIRVELEEATVRLEVGAQIGEVHVVVAAGEQRVPHRLEDLRLVAAEVVGEEKVQCGARLVVVVVVPVGIVPGAVRRHLLRGEPEQEEVFLAGRLGHLDGSAVPRADGERPVIMNFMLLVPLAS